MLLLLLLLSPCRHATIPQITRALRGSIGPGSRAPAVIALPFSFFPFHPPLPLPLRRRPAFERQQGNFIQLSNQMKSAFLQACAVFYFSSSYLNFMFSFFSSAPLLSRHKLSSAKIEKILYKNTYMHTCIQPALVMAEMYLFMCMQKSMWNV